MRKATVVGLVLVVLCIVAVTVVHAASIQKTLGGSGWEITDPGDITTTKATRYKPVYDAGTCSGATTTISAANGSMQTLTLATHSTCTINWAQPQEGTQAVHLLVTQGVASAPIAWTSTLFSAGVSTQPSTTSGSKDWFTCYLTGSQTFCNSLKTFQ